MLNRWCAPSSTPVSPTSRNVDGVSGLTGNPTVICPINAPCATAAGATPSIRVVSTTTGSTPK
jgi:hypothetical protein